MAAITPKAGAPYSGITVLQSAATGTTTDWLDVPKWCSLIIVHLDITVAGTSTILTVKSANPVTRDDTRTALIFTSATVTAIGYHSYTIAPNGTVLADSATVGTAAVAAGAIPSLLGVTTTPTGSTYSSAIEFRGLGR
jgi:hypothetical protein